MERRRETWSSAACTLSGFSQRAATHPCEANFFPPSLPLSHYLLLTHTNGTYMGMTMIELGAI